MKFVQLLPVAFCHWSKRAMRATDAAKGEREREEREGLLFILTWPKCPTVRHVNGKWYAVPAFMHATRVLKWTKTCTHRHTHAHIDSQAAGGQLISAYASKCANLLRFKYSNTRTYT